jgi:serine O-acetyltransferase
VAEPESAREVRRRIRAAQPRLREAVVADARMTLHYRGEGRELRSRGDLLREIVRLAWTSDAFLGQVLYRVKTRVDARGIPLLPRLIHRISMMTAQISIDESVVIEPGVCIAHGQVVIGGVTHISEGTLLTPFISIGLREGSFVGPTLERGVQVGTGARILGPVRVGEGARIGANAVVIRDVASGDTVVGVPARSRRV